MCVARALTHTHTHTHTNTHTHTQFCGLPDAADDAGALGAEPPPAASQTLSLEQLRAYLNRRGDAELASGVGIGKAAARHCLCRHRVTGCCVALACVQAS
jgi:hypothetical protein